MREGVSDEAGDYSTTKMGEDSLYSIGMWLC